MTTAAAASAAKQERARKRAGPRRPEVDGPAQASAKSEAKSQAKAPGRPRSEECHKAILDAATQLLDTEDYHKITIERIASLAKVGKPTIYRWWPSKADVILEAYREEGLRRVPAVPVSADALTDLEDFMKRLLRAHRNRTQGRGLRALIAESQVDEAFRSKFFDVFLTMRRGLMREIIEHGIETGRFRNDLDVNVVLDLMFGAFWYRLLSGTEAPLDDAFAEQVVAMVAPSLLASA